MSPPSLATAGRTRVSSNSLIWSHDLLILGRYVFLGHHCRGLDSWAPGDEVLHKRSKDLRLKFLPGLVLCLGHGNEVGT